ncbi:MAG: YcxB family protein [Clostridia bacterium]|nr:YcxB family protein [Clostridia bacterium]
MGEQQGKGLFRLSFLFDEAILGDFEALYLQKKDMPLSTRVVLGVLGAAGALYFGYMTYKEGAQLTRIGYLLICSVLLVLAFSRSGKRPDDTVAKYRKHYLNRHATVAVDEEGIELRLEGQKNYARSKFKEVYGLYETDLCLYCVVKGKAYYILPKAYVADDRADDLKKYLEKKCAKRFQRYDIPTT